MDEPDIGISYHESIPCELFEEFKQSISNESLKLLVEDRPDSGPQMCSEWFMVPTVVAFIAAGYFNGVLSEIGKEHYKILKEKLSRLSNDVMYYPKIEPVLIGTKGKINPDNPYSLAFSVYAQSNDGNTIKLLLPKNTGSTDYSEIVEKFLEFLEEYYSGVKTMENVGFDSTKTAPGRTIFVRMNPDTKEIEWLEWLKR